MRERVREGDERESERRKRERTTHAICWIVSLFK